MLNKRSFKFDLAFNNEAPIASEVPTSGLTNFKAPREIPNFQFSTFNSQFLNA